MWERYVIDVWVVGSAIYGLAAGLNLGRNRVDVVWADPPLLLFVGCLVLPGALGVERLLAARSERSGWAGLTAVLLLVGAARSWSGLPATVPASAWLGVVAGAILWIVGLAALRAEGAAWR
jgi:hypothetical protein